MPPGPQKHSDWQPLAHPVFRALWIATVVSNVGSAMQDAVAPAFMRDLSTDRLIVALMQSAAALPVCLLALPAGAMADLLNRRRLLIATQLWMLAAAALLACLTFAHVVAPHAPGARWLLLALTFLLGFGAAMSGPAFLRVLPELVGPEQMPAAMALNSIALNVARAAGPALGALALLALGGPAAAFALNALSFAGVAWVLFRWKEPPEDHPAPPEGFLPAMSAGFHYARHAPRLRAVLLRVAVFISCASALWALTVVLAAEELHLSETGYCLLMACLGIGAIVGILLMPPIQRRMSTDALVACATAAFTAAMVALAFCPWVSVTCIILFIIGANWVVILTNFNIATQRAVPAWVKGRAMSLYLLTLWGSWALGAAAWGALAKATNAHTALAAAGAGLAAGLATLHPWRLAPAHPVDFTPAFKGPPPSPAALETSGGERPVHVAIEYRVPSDRIAEFRALMCQLRPQRLRNGARRWQLLETSSTPLTFTERFHFTSPMEFALQKTRTTRSDALLEEQAAAFRAPPNPSPV